MIERVSVTLSLLLATSRLLHRGPVAAPPPHGVQIQQTLDLAERVEGRLQDVMGVVRAQGLREDVLDARRLEDRSHRAARDDAGALDGRLQEDAPGAEVARDLARNRRVLERHEDQVLLRVLDGLSDRLRHFVRLSKAHAHVAPTVADDDERRERKPATALDRSEEHTSELQSPCNLVCRLLLEK